jgi:Domain of unknown function (DUF4412)
MKKLTAPLAGLALLLGAMPAAAGVVITQTRHITGGAPIPDEQQTIMVQGNKQATVETRHTIIMDLDKNKVYVIDPAKKSYIEVPFPPPGMMSAMMLRGLKSAMDLKKTGTTREIAGYKCADYEGGGQMMMGPFTVKECFSADAPGAKEFMAFQNKMIAKFKGAGMPVPAGELPNGLPLAINAEMKRNTPPAKEKTSGEKASGEAAKSAKAPAAPSSMTNDILVSKIEAKKLAKDVFDVPAGYTKTELPPMMAGMHGGPGMRPAAPAEKQPAAPPAAPAPESKPSH